MNRLSETYQQHITVLPVTLKTVDPVYDKVHVTINRSAIPTSSYYPYGMEMPGCTFTAQFYRYAYQGSEQAPEYNAAGGNIYTTFFRTLDSRLGRWSTPDVVSQPWQSPYCSMDNNPVALVDPWGASAGKPPKGVPEAKCPGETGAPSINSKGFVQKGAKTSQNLNFTNTFDPGQLIGNYQQINSAQNYFTLKVQPNATLGGVAKEYGISVEAIKAANPDIDWEGERVDGDLIYTGEEINVPMNIYVLEFEADYLNEFEALKPNSNIGKYFGLKEGQYTEKWTFTESGKLDKFEIWLQNPSESFGEGVVKIIVNIGYGTPNSISILITGRSIGGGDASTEKVDAFFNLVISSFSKLFKVVPAFIENALNIIKTTKEETEKNKK